MKNRTNVTDQPINWTIPDKTNSITITSSIFAVTYYHPAGGSYDLGAGKTQ